MSCKRTQKITSKSLQLSGHGFYRSLAVETDTCRERVLKKMERHVQGFEIGRGQYNLQSCSPRQPLWRVVTALRWMTPTQLLQSESAVSALLITFVYFSPFYSLQSFSWRWQIGFEFSQSAALFELQ